MNYLFSLPHCNAPCLRDNGNTTAFLKSQGHYRLSFVAKNPGRGYRSCQRGNGKMRFQRRLFNPDRDKSEAPLDREDS